MTTAHTIGVLGGTFDPIHFGHLDAAEAAHTALCLDEIRLLPLSDPPHRSASPMTNAFHRFALVALAIEDRPGVPRLGAGTDAAGPLLHGRFAARHAR